MKTIFLTIISLTLTLTPLLAETWVIMPFQVRNMPSLEDRELDFQDKTISIELAKAARLYLSIRGLKNIIPLKQVTEFVNNKNRNDQQDYTAEQLQSTAKKFFADYILTAQVSYSENYYFIESKVFYASSNLLTNPMQSKDGILLNNLSKHLNQRFSLNRFKLKSNQNKNKPLIILADVSGKNTQDFQEIVKTLSLYDPSSSSFCTVDGSGDLLKLDFSDHLKVTVPALKKVRAGGGGRYAIKQSKLWECARNYAKQQKEAEIVALLGSMPAPKSRDFYNTKGSIRKLIESRRTLALLPSSLSAESRSFWNNSFKSVAELKGSYMEDVRYQLKAGLSNGTSLNIFQEGFKITGSLQNLPTSASNWQLIPTQLQSNFRRSKLSKAYEIVTGNTVITNHEVQGNYQYHFQNFWNSEESTSLVSNFYRSLLVFDNGSFWVSFPKDKAKSIKELATIHFMTHMETGSEGIPYQNNPMHTYLIENPEEVPDFLKIDLSDYLVNPYDYRGKSFSGSTLYYFTGSNTQ